jgi:leader peptidase (prepilin peptidase)/N-methyltransferase
LGVKKIIVALLFAYWFGVLVGVLLIIFKKRKMGSEIPFGTFLAVGTILAMYYGEYIIRWYFNIIG